MKKVLCAILLCCCFLMACNKKSTPTPMGQPKPMQIVISDITSTLTIYSFSVTKQPSSSPLIDIHSQTENKTYSLNVNSGDTLQLTYFLELEGVKPAINPVVTFICDGVT